MRRKAKRPKWASRLSGYDWQHLQDSQVRRVPTLRDLRTDARECWICRSILRQVSPEEAATLPPLVR